MAVSLADLHSTRYVAACHVSLTPSVAHRVVWKHLAICRRSHFSASPGSAKKPRRDGSISCSKPLELGHPTDCRALAQLANGLGRRKICSHHEPSQYRSRLSRPVANLAYCRRGGWRVGPARCVRPSTRTPNSRPTARAGARRRWTATLFRDNWSLSVHRTR